MTFKCSVPGCRSNYEGNSPKFSIFSFPKNKMLRLQWIKAMPKEGFMRYKYSKVCELHFEPSQIIREASAYDPRTGATLTAPLDIPRLRKGAVPTIFDEPVKHSNKRVENLSLTEESDETDGNQVAKIFQTGTETESQNIAEPSIVIKQEPVETTAEPAPMVIDNIFYLEESVPSSSTLPSSGTAPIFITISPYVESTLPVAIPVSTYLGAAAASFKPESNGKTNISKLDGSVSRQGANPAALHWLAEPPILPKRRSRPRPLAKAKKSSDFIQPTMDTQNATREIFQSLLSGSKGNPSSGSRTGEKPGDLFDVFADFIAEKLREMDWENSAFALRSILDIVYKAGQVQQNSGDEEKDISDPGSDSNSL